MSSPQQAQETLRLLHLSDFHWKKQNQADQKIMVQALLDDLSILTKDKKVDLIIFSGDIVYSGHDINDFTSAKTSLIDPLLSSLGLTNNEIFLCPGNHDIDREILKTDDYLEEGLKTKLISTERLNEHIDRFLPTSLPDDIANARLSNYFSFIRNHYHSTAIFKSDYVDCFRLDTPIGQIGLATFNTSWRSIGAGQVEKETLLLADRAVQAAKQQLSGCSLAIAVFHHPLDWLAPWNASSVRTPLFLTFDLLMFGHVHDEMPSIIENAIGTSLFAQAGCLFDSPSYTNGYQMIDITPDETTRVDVTMRTWYHRPRSAFGPAERICENGKKSFEVSRKNSGNRLGPKDLLAILKAIDVAADSHVSTLHVDTKTTFEQAFTCPPLSYKTENELSQLKPVAYKASLIDIKTVAELTGVTVLSGSRESGKTTLTFKIAKDALQLAGALAKVPVRVDFSALKAYDTLEGLVRSHVGSLQLDLSARKIYKNHRCLFIVDNVALTEANKLSRLQELITESSDSHDWIILLDGLELLSSGTISAEFLASRKPIYIQPLGRNDIKSLVTKFSPIASTLQSDVDVIVKLIDDNKLPRSAYIVTLLYSVIRTISSDSIINEATLLDSMIDRLLNKDNPNNIVRSSTDFGGLNIILEETAFWFSQSDANGLTENTFIQNLALYLTDRGILEGAPRILESFIKTGVLEKREEAIRFRYRSFQSFFLARYAARTRTFIPKLLEEMGILRFSKEFSLLCDLSRHDQELLTFLEIIITELRPDVFDTVDKAAFLKVQLNNKYDDIVDGRMTQISDGPQSAIEIDEMHDFRDRAMSTITTKVDTLEKESTEDPSEMPKPFLQLLGYIEAWRVWGRAITSLDFVELSVRKPSFLRLLDHWARIASLISEAGEKFLTQVFENAAKDGKSFSKKSTDRMHYTARVNMPIGSVQAIFSHIGSSSVHRLLCETFDELDISSPEALGAVCMLIKQMPDGWNDRVKRFIDHATQSADEGVIKHFLLEALYQEYLYRNLSAIRVEQIQSLIALLLTKGGFAPGKYSAVLGQLKQKSSKIEVLSHAGKL